MGKDQEEAAGRESSAHRISIVRCWGGAGAGQGQGTCGHACDAGCLAGVAAGSDEREHEGTWAGEQVGKDGMEATGMYPYQEHVSWRMAVRRACCTKAVVPAAA